MTDQTGRPPEERLPAPRPSNDPTPAARFSASSSAHRNDLTPERAARIVRQSAAARWVGFLAVTIVALFVIGYYFYEVGLPGGMSEPRLDAATKEQQVTAVERGYQIYQANCAQCHGVNGEGGKGPVLNRQDKLFAHLSLEYLRNMLQVGGRYACGNPSSIMPIWSNTGNPAGPLNYMQVENLIAFLRAQKGTTYRVLDINLFEPVIDPVTKKEITFEGWVDAAYQPAPGATPYPACWSDEFNTPAASGTPAPSGGAATPAPGAVVLNVVALNIAFDVKELSAPADTAFSIHFNNQDQGIPHNVDIKDGSGASVTDPVPPTVNGLAETDYQFPALPAGSYTFVCTVHPNMTGTLKVGN